MIFSQLPGTVVHAPEKLRNILRYFAGLGHRCLSPHCFWFSIGLALCATIFTIQAGSPLICHSYDLGDAQSLPWGHGRDAVGFDSGDPNCNTKQLSADTLRILDVGGPVLVRGAVRSQRPRSRGCGRTTPSMPRRRGPRNRMRCWLRMCGRTCSEPDGHDFR